MVEIGMGKAFEKFSHCGGLYPCASFNANEKIEFNFGAKAFKFGPPVGFMGYIEHVRNIYETSKKFYTHVIDDMNDDCGIPGLKLKSFGSISEEKEEYYELESHSKSYDHHLVVND